MTILTRNLKLRITPDLTADARYNLNRIDLLATTLDFSNTDEVILRSREGITIQPNANDLGGQGTGGTINLGSEVQPVDEINFYSQQINIDGLVTLCDKLTSEGVQFKSDSKLDTNFVELIAPTGLTQNTTFILPSEDGATGQVLTTDGSGQLSWVSVSTNVLNENNIFIGDNTNNAISVDTSTLGQIEASITGGLNIRSQSIVDSNISPTAAIDADKIDDSTSTNKFTSQTEIDKLATIEPNATADQTASEVPFTPAGGLVSTDVQSAIVEAASGGAVTSVNGENGAVILNIEDLDNVSITSPQNSDSLTFNGSQWVNVATSSISSLDDLSDVDVSTVTPNANDVLLFDGTEWSPSGAIFGQLQGLQSQVTTLFTQQGTLFTNLGTHTHESVLAAPIPFDNILSQDETDTNILANHIACADGTGGWNYVDKSTLGGSTFRGFRVLAGPQTVVVNQPPEPINYSSVTDHYDTTGGYDRSTQIFTVTEPGFWKFRAQATDNSFRQKAITMDLSLSVNGIFKSIASESNASATVTTRSIVTVSLEETILLEVGDQVTITGFCRGDSFVLDTSNSNIRNSFSGSFQGPPVTTS